MIEMPKELEKQLERLAKKAGKTKDDYTYNIIIEHLEDMEDIEIAKRASEEAKGKTYTMEQVFKQTT